MNDDTAIKMLATSPTIMASFFYSMQYCLSFSFGDMLVHPMKFLSIEIDLDFPVGPTVGQRIIMGLSWPLSRSGVYRKETIVVRS